MNTARCEIERIVGQNCVVAIIETLRKKNLLIFKSVFNIKFKRNSDEKWHDAGVRNTLADAVQLGYHIIEELERESAESEAR
jgi:hypothetical protein